MMSKKEKPLQTKLYGIIFKDTGEILTPDSFRKYWPNYGASGSCLYGWRPPKKVYYTLGTARSGFAHVPEQLKSQLAIAEFKVDAIIEDGNKIRERQEKSKREKDLKYQISNIKYEIDKLEKDKERISDLDSELKQLREKLKNLE